MCMKIIWINIFTFGGQFKISTNACTYITISETDTVALLCNLLTKLYTFLSKQQSMNSEALGIKSNLKRFVSNG